MKKIKHIVLITVIILLSGCMSDMEPYEEHESIYDNLIYDFEEMTFTNTSDSDILKSTGDSYLDFKYVYNILMDKDLTAEEKIAYKQLFTITDQIVKDTDIVYSTVFNFSSSEFNEISNGLSITLSLENIVAFNSLKTLILDLEEMSNTNNFAIAKLDYIEKRLDITLSDDEESGLALLQEQYSELRYNTIYSHDFEPDTFDDLITRFNDSLNYTPTENDLDRLEDAYNMIISLKNS